VVNSRQVVVAVSIGPLGVLGAPAAWSFGPQMQFVSRKHFASYAFDSLHPGESSGTRGDFFYEIGAISKCGKARGLTPLDFGLSDRDHD